MTEYFNWWCAGVAGVNRQTGEAIAAGEAYRGWKSFASVDEAREYAEDALANMDTGVYKPAKWLGAFVDGEAPPAHDPLNVPSSQDDTQ